MFGYFCAVPLKIRSAMLRVEFGPPFDGRRGHSLHQVHAAIGVGRMGVDGGVAAVELLPDRIEERVTKPLVAVVRQHADAVDVERVEGVADLLQRLVDMRKRQRREDAEPSRMIGHHLLTVLVRVARDLDRDRLADRNDLRRGRRKQGRCDPALVHILQRFLNRPVRQRRIGAPDDVHRAEPDRGRDMMMHVDAVRLGLRKGPGPEAHAGKGERRAPGQQLAAIHAGGGEGLGATVASE